MLVVAQDGVHDAVAHEVDGHTLAEVVEDVVLVQPRLGGLLSHPVVGGVDQLLGGDFPLQPVQPVAPLLQGLVLRTGAHYLIAVYHGEVVARHEEHGKARGVAVEDVGRANLALQRVHRSRDDLIPVHLYQAVDALLVGVVHARLLVLERFEFQVQLACP